MLSVAKPYSSFLLPLAREDAQVPEADHPSSNNHTPTEFFYMQWGFYDPPAHPESSSAAINRLAGGTAKDGQLPPTSTVIFTPLVEFQTHKSFAVPHLVITHYTDLAETHGLVLLRGEITPRGSSADNSEVQYQLSQHHAQALALGVQKFYLWTDEGNEREALLKTFHEHPQDFKWEDLLRLSDSAV